MTSFKKSVLSNHILIALFLLAGFGFSCRSTEMVEAESIPKPALKEETELKQVILIHHITLLIIII